jgi:hypothetical protein
MIPNLYIFHYGHAKPIEFHKMKREFYENELKKHKTDDGSDAAAKFDEKYDEFVNYKENLNEILAYDGPHPEVIKTHPLALHVEEFYLDKTKEKLFNRQEIKNWKQSKAYSSRLPTIPQWMIYQKRMQPIYNEIIV